MQDVAGVFIQTARLSNREPDDRSLGQNQNRMPQAPVFCAGADCKDGTSVAGFRTPERFDTRLKTVAADIRPARLSAA